MRRGAVVFVVVSTLGWVAVTFAVALAVEMLGRVMGW